MQVREEAPDVAALVVRRAVVRCEPAPAEPHKSCSVYVSRQASKQGVSYVTHLPSRTNAVVS